MINSGKLTTARPLTKIIGGILTSTNTFTHNDNKSIKKHIKEQTDLKSIDIGCIADYGSFNVDYNGEEDTKLINVENYERRYLEYYKNRTFRKITFSNANNSLVSFFLQLTRYLQQAIGTIPAIDLNAYSKAIEFVIDEKL